MEKEKFNALLTLKIRDLISLVISEKKLNFEEALDYLYPSKLYEKLSDEETKLWHLSAEKLFEMVEIEKNTGELIYPDFV